MFLFYRLVYDVNRNILWAYFPHGFYGLLCAHWNYVYSRWSQEKINHHFQHSMIHLSIFRLTFLFILYVFWNIYLVLLRLQRYICLVFYVLFKNLLRSNNCKRQKDYKYCWIWVNQLLYVLFDQMSSTYGHAVFFVYRFYLNLIKWYNTVLLKFYQNKYFKKIVVLIYSNIFLTK